MLKVSTDFKNSDSLTAWVRYGLYAQIAVAAVSIVSGWMEYSLLSDYLYDVYTSQEQAIADGEANDMRQGLIGLVYLLVFIVSGFLILRWIHRANYNARQLGAQDMQFTSGWAIGYYFIPVLALWKPYQAMKEIWQASNNPTDWQQQTLPSLLPLWWGLWLASNFLGQAVFRLSLRAEEVQALMILNIVTQISDVLDIVLAVVFLSLVNKIYHAQMTHLAKIH